METTFLNVSLKNIVADPNQPRKYYDETAMAELTDSVRENGVIQPILLRPHGKKYMLVCGERRYRASNNAALKEIPSVIRNLSDAEALELQIIENLQRKEVHPMEEAVAFKSLAETFSTEEIANRIGKSESYVVKRIKLNDLIDDAQEILFTGHITLTNALLMSRLSSEVQSEIIKLEAPNDWKTKKGKEKDWMLEDVDHYVDVSEHDLSKALFKITDAKIYPEAGSCKGCVFNTANHPMLFDEYRKSFCTKTTCFEIKNKNARIARYEDISKDPSIICIVTFGYGDSHQNDVKAAKEAGLNILSDKLYNIVYEPNEAKNFDDWFEEESSYYQDEEDEEKFDIDEAKKDFEEYLSKSKKKILEYNNDLSNGMIKKAYVAAGNDMGSEVYIRLKSDAAKATVDAGNGEDGNAAVEIARIKEKEERNKVLDAEKVWQSAKLLINDSLYSATIYNNVKLSELELNALGKAMYDNLSLGVSDRFLELFKVEDIYEITFNDKAINVLSRIFMLDKLANNYNSHLTCDDNLLAYNILSHYLPKEIGNIEISQQEVAEQRKKRVDARIFSLNRKIKD
jgi:ParB family transcriptional regulator, chromosome partitioning protein